MRITFVLLLAAGVTALTPVRSFAADTKPVTKQFASEKQNYKCDYPAHWRRINPDQIGGAELTLTPDADKIQTRLMVLFQPNDADGKQPTDQEMEEFLKNQLRSVADTSIDKTEDLKVDGQPARKVKLSIQMKNKQAGLLSQDVVYCKQPQGVYMIMMAGPKEKIGDHEGGFDTIVESFRFTRKKQ